MKPIIFNTEMVKAILDSSKTQTRRVFSKTQLKYFDYAQKLGEINGLDDLHENNFSYILDFSKYKVDDILYVKETFALVNGGQYIFKADDNEKKYESVDLNIKWNSAVHLTQIEARIFLKVTNVRVERLQDITAINMDSDMGAISPIISKLIAIDDYIELQNKYKKYWNSTAKDGYKWEDNPYVFVYEFERIEK